MSKVPLTPEEKQQLNAQKKLEKKIKLIEKKKQEKRDYLRREVKYGHISIRRYEKEWRQTLINITLPKMKEDMESAWHNFERVIDSKNFIISLRMDEVKDAEEHCMMNFRCHMERVDQLIDLFHVQLDELNADNEKQRAKRLQNESEVEQNNLIYAEQENFMKTIIFALEVGRKQQMQDGRAECFSKIQEEDKKNIRMVHRLRILFEKELQEVWKSTEKFLKVYENETRERKKVHTQLITHDDTLQILLIKQLEKIRKSYEYLKICKQKLSDTQKLLGSKLKDLHIEHNFFSFAFNALKNKLVEDRGVDFNQIRIQTVFYNEAIHELEKLNEKGELILQVAAVCRKLETQREKITPFPVNIKDDISIIMNDQQEYTESMDLFWQRVAQVDASRHSVYEERDFLKTENDILKLRIHQYCQCVTCPAKQAIKKSKVKFITEGVIEKQKYDKQKFKQFTSHEYNDELDD